MSTHQEFESPLRTRPEDLQAFKEFAQARKNMLLCVETFFKNSEEAKTILTRDFPNIKIFLLSQEKYSCLMNVLLTDRNDLDNFLNSDWLKAGVTSIRVQKPGIFD